VLDLPGVGQNLQDHIAVVGHTWLVKGRSAYNPFLYATDPRTWINWKIDRTGPLAATSGVEAMGFVSSSLALSGRGYGVFNASDGYWPDIQLTCSSAQAGFDGGASYRDYLGMREDVYK